MPSLYASYIQEREGKQILETDKGFATYQFSNDYCYIEDIYVLPEYRKEGIASQMADQIASIAKEKGYKKLYGTVAPAARASTESLKVLLAYGFKLQAANPGLIVMVKEI